MARSTRAKVKKEFVEQPVEGNTPSTASRNAAFAMDDIPMYDGDHTTIDSNMAIRPPSSSHSTVHTATTFANTMNAGTQPSQSTETLSQPHDAMQSLGNNSRQLIKTIQNLESLRIDATLPSLPKFVVVGDQSHGKSSILEAVCDISLPRAEGACTRCPFQITTTAGKEPEAWKCKITLLIRYNYNPKAGSGAPNKYPKWEDTGAQGAVEFDTVYDKADLDVTLRLAQIAILNPKVPFEHIRAHPDSYAEGSHVQFSPNIISLEISAPGLPELSLIDLPGAINVSANESDQHLVGFIEKLIKNYLRDEKALVLVAASADQDVEVSTALRFVRSCKAQPRAMGVLTKPDLMHKARIQYVRNILGGNGFELKGGWFVAKLLSQDQIHEGVSNAQARVIEKEFFEQEPWGDLLSAYSHRFGVASLQDALSQKLTQHIVRDLPEIASRIQNRLDAVEDALADFPEESKEPCLDVMRVVDSIAAVIVEHLKGEALVNTFKKDYRALFYDLARRLKDARPKVDLRSPKQKAICIDSDSDSNEDVESPPVTPIPTPSKARKGNNGHAIPTPSRQNGHRVRCTPIKQEGASQSVPEEITFSLEQIRQAYDNGRASSLPDANWKVSLDLTARCLVSWGSLVTDTLDAVDSVVTKMLSQCMQEMLATRKDTALYAEVKRTVDNLFSELMRDQRAMVQHYIACECHKPATYQETAFKAQLALVQNKLREQRQQARVEEMQSKSPDRAKKSGNIEDKLGPDAYADEIRMISKPLAYYDLASAVVPDTVAKLLEIGLIFPLQTQLKDRLNVELQAGDKESCIRLLAEDPVREENRRKLLGEKDKLVRALNELQTLTST